MTDIRDFINSFLPDNIPKKKRQQLYDEMECHILDRADFYTEIGYDGETALRKSMECFGEEKEMKESIRNELSDLYREKLYYAVIAGLIPVIFNFICVFTGGFIHTADYAGAPSAETVFMSSLYVSFVILHIAFCRKKGYRKSLIATGISNILIICTLIFVFYPQGAFYGLVLNISYLLERLTPLIMKNAADDLPNYFSYYGPVIFLAGTALISFVLAKRVRNRGCSEKKSLKGVAVLAFVMCGVCFLNGVTYKPAKEYFREYRTWFDKQNDTVTEEAITVFGSIPLGCTYDDAKAYLGYLGYVNTEDYISGLSREEQKMFRHNLSEMNFFFSDDYEIFFKEKDKYHSRDDNGLFFIRTDEKGTVTGKGIGVGSEYEDRYGSKRHYCSESYDTGKCEKDFISTEKGDSKDEVLKKFAEENGHLYSLFSETEKGVQKDYCRIHSYGSPSEHDLNDWNKDRDIFIQLWFTDGKLEKATFEYYGFQYNEEVVKEIK